MASQEPYFNRLLFSLSKTPGILGKERYAQTAVIIPFIKLENEYHLLFEVRAAGISQGSEVCFPGGRFDPAHDSSLLDTAVRESCEELGISKDKIEVLGQTGTLLAAAAVSVDAFPAILTINSIDDFNIARREVSRIFTLPVSYLKEQVPEEYALKLEVHPYEVKEDGSQKVLFPAKELGLPQRYHKPWSGRKHRTLVYKTYEGVIWGITAELLSEILKVV